MFRNLKLGKRIIIGFGFPLVITICLGIGIYVISSKVEDISSRVRDGGHTSFAEVAYQMKLDVVQVQQWLTDISATRAQDGLDDGLEKAEVYSQSFRKGLNRFRQLYEIEHAQTQLQKLDNLDKAFQDYYDSGKAMAKVYIEEGSTGGNKMMSTFDQAADKLAEQIEPFLEQQSKGLHGTLDEIASLSQLMCWAVSLSGILIVLCSVIVAWLITRSTTGILHRIVKGLSGGAEQVAGTSHQLASTSRQLAEGASEQAAAIEETSASLEEMSSMTRQNAENARQANQLTMEASQVVEKANVSMNDLTNSMAEISKASEETQKIIKTIDEISFQTNLLALNAAVEAARAGEAGAGFAVVANEVRSLAMRAADAARNTADLIEGTVKKVMEGSNLLQRTNEDFGSVASTVIKSGELVREIAAASQEQAQGIEQLNRAVTEMDTVTQRNAANAEESAAASEQMNAQAERMEELVGGLIALVGGNGSGKAGKRRSSEATGSGKQTIQNVKVVTQPAKALLQSRKGNEKRYGVETTILKKSKREIRPADVIPLEDEGFEDF